MAMFLGTHQNRFDAKGRVSIPAAFRTILRENATASDPLLILRPSHLHPCIEGWTYSAFMALTASLSAYDPFSEEYEDVSLSLYADAYPLDSDKEGRIVIPEILKEHAELEKEVSFMGLGQSFQIWEPEKALERRRVARAKVKQESLARALKKGTTPSIEKVG